MKLPFCPAARGELLRNARRARHTTCAAPGEVGRCRRPALAGGRQNGCVHVRKELREKLVHPRIAVPLSSGHTGPSCGEQRTERAWLPALLVWTWVRAYRQLHAGNAGLRPATTSFPFALHCLERGGYLMQRSRQERLRPLPFSGLHMQEQWFCAHAEARSALTQVVSQKKAKAALSIRSTTFPRVSRAGEVRNREDAANLRRLLPLRFAENCAERALHDVRGQSDC
jgi:hypothetical protein